MVCCWCRYTREHSLSQAALQGMGGNDNEAYSPVFHGAMHLYNLTFWLRPDVQVSITIGRHS